jgi:mRNA-degrading endonuclease YafQ of YafQ-DinJ toxin-antitoxin module
VPAVNIVVDQDVSTKNAVEIVHQLQDGEPSIALYEGHADQGRLMIYPECLLEGDADIIVSRFGESLSM